MYSLFFVKKPKNKKKVNYDALLLIYYLIILPQVGLLFNF